MFIEIENCFFPHYDPSVQSLKHARQLVGKANQHRNQMRTELRLKGKGKKKGESQKVYLGSKLVRLSALVEAAKRLPLEERLSISEYKELASELKLHEEVPEKVRFFLKQKSNGKYRCICIFGVMHRAAQSIVADMVEAQFEPSNFQYNVAGRGIQTAIKEVRKCFGAGLSQAACLDISAFYDKFEHAGVMTSGITDRKVIEQVVIGKHYKLEALAQKGGHTSGSLSPYIDDLHTRGIAQGSVCSPIIGNFYISKIKAEFPPGTRVLNYADDFLVLAKSGESREMAINALKASVEALSVGKFELLEKSGSSSNSAFDFLGHHFVHANGNLTVSLSAAARLRQTNVSGQRMDRFDVLLGQWKALAGAGENVLAVVGRINDLLLDWASIIKGWQGAYSEVDNIDEEIEHHMGMWIDCCAKVEIDPEKLFCHAKAYSELKLVYGTEGSGPPDIQ